MNDFDKQLMDTKIRQQINAAHRGAFYEKFPGQCEHILRLLAERLHLGLDKRDGTDPSNPETWRLNSQEIVDLSTAVYYIQMVRKSLND